MREDIVRGEPFEFGAYRPLGKGEVVNKEHNQNIPTQGGKATEPYVPARIYGPTPASNNTPARKGK